MKLSEFKISFSIESYDEKTAENYRNYYVAEEHIDCKHQRYRSQILIEQIVDLNEDGDSASPEMVIKMYLHFC